ncbi:UTRA domain-containing protein [Rhodococcus sp. 14C212]|nr:UTRA domain-containing protein [Rhodococcus sp. 14C212]
MADFFVARELEVPIGSPVLFAVRTRHDDRGPLEVTHMWYRGDVFTSGRRANVHE